MLSICHFRYWIFYEGNRTGIEVLARLETRSVLSKGTSLKESQISRKPSPLALVRSNGQVNSMEKMRMLQGSFEWEAFHGEGSKILHGKALDSHTIKEKKSSACVKNKLDWWRCSLCCLPITPGLFQGSRWRMVTGISRAFAPRTFLGLHLAWRPFQPTFVLCWEMQGERWQS